MLALLHRFLSYHILPNSYNVRMNILAEDHEAKIQTLAARLKELLYSEDELMRVLETPDAK